MYLRIVGQNAVIVNFPMPVPRGTALGLQVVYGGRIEPQELDREALTFDPQDQEPIVLLPEPRYIYSNRSYWYPQATVADYATARLRDHGAAGLRRGRQRHAGRTAVTSGRTGAAGRSRAQAIRVHLGSPDALSRLRHQPLQRRDHRGARAVVERRAPGDERRGRGAPRPVDWRCRGGDVALADRAGQSASGVARPRHRRSHGGDLRVLHLAHRRCAVSELHPRVVRERSARRPQPRRTSRSSTSPCRPRRSCGATIRSASTAIPSFFLAHELAHQWWGQAVGWKNYHEQWLSEGFAQYFAAMYAETGTRRPRRSTTCCGRCGDGRSTRHRRGRSISATASGTSRATAGSSARSSTTRRRWCCTCCGAWSATRRSSAGIRAFYAEWRFQKAGTDDFRAAMAARERPGSDRVLRRVDLRHRRSRAFRCGTRYKGMRRW